MKITLGESAILGVEYSAGRDKYPDSWRVRVVEINGPEIWVFLSYDPGQFPISVASVSIDGVTGVGGSKGFAYVRAGSLAVK